MRSANLRWLVVGLLAVLAAQSGCASDEKTINRVQADGAIEKAVLMGSEWYTHTTVIDTDYGSMTFVGDGDTFNRIKFEIQRDYLIAKRSDEWITDSEGASGTAGAVEQTAVVAMFPILSHFDIKRAYNPITGEEQNVVEENTTDRPWNDRSFIRVDWKQNLVKDLQFSVTGGMGGINLLPVSYWDQTEDENADYAQHFDRDEDGKISYFDVVNKYFAEPGKIAGIEACLLVIGMHKDCAPGHVWARRSFMRVEDRDYEPMVYTTDRMDHFGYFLNMRDKYDRDYGVTRFNRNRFVARHNIWAESHKRDGKKPLSCTSDAECGGKGSKCDLAFGQAHGSAGACTIPHRDREVRPIAYHLSQGFPEDLENDAFDLVASWNETFKSTVASLRRLECEETKSGGCDKFTADETEDVFVVCHNPVAKSDAEACGAEGTIARIGDLRYHQLSWVIEPHSSSPLGFGPSFTDPYTGEIINASAYVYGAALDIYTAQARDLIAMLQGDLDPVDLQEDSEYESWIAKLSQTRERRSSAAREADFHAIALDGDHARQVVESMDFSWLEERVRTRLGAPRKLRSPEEVALRFKAAKRAVGAVGETMALAKKSDVNRQKLLDTEIEQLMLDDETYALAGMAPPGLFPGQQLTPDQIETYSPLRGRSMDGIAALNEARRLLEINRRHCILDQEFVDAGLLGLVEAIDEAASKGGTIKWYGKEYNVGTKGRIDYEAVRAMVRHPIFHAVMAHEVGHTLGLRHNFSGSYDALNYSKDYWKLRDDGKMAPRAWDPLSDKEIKGRIREHQYSTVMDYGHNFIVSDANGVGHYDYAAIKMGYGDLAEVFTKVPSANVQTVAGLTVQASGGALATLDPNLTSNGVQMFAYTDWPSLVGGVNNLEAREDVRYSSLKNVTSQIFGTTQPALSADGKKPAVPYQYCGDEFADFRPDCLRYDAGADPYETLQSVIDGYWEYYPLSHFMHQRIGFDPDSIKLRTASRFFSKIESANRIYSFYRGIFPDLIASLSGEQDPVALEELVKEFMEGQNGLGGYTLGVRAGFDLMRLVVATPEPTRYTTQTRPDGTTALVEGGSSIFDPEVDSFNGRYLRTGFDFGPDFSWIFFTRAGFFHDKQLALESMLHAEANFVGQDTDADARQFSTSYYTTFPAETTEMLRGMIGNDWTSFAARRGEDGTLTYPRFDEVLKRGEGMTGTMLDPNVGFSLQMATMVYAAIYVPTAFEQDYSNKSRIFVKGGAEAIDLAVPTVEWIDPTSGITYVAGSYLDADGIERGVGARMLAWAQALETAGLSGELADWIDNINIMRNIVWHTGFGQPSQ